MPPSVRLTLVLGLLPVGSTACSRPPAQVTVPNSPASVPSPPAWATPLLGRAISKIPGEQGCEGTIDLIDAIYTGDHPGSQLEGWAWEKAGRPIARVLVVDKSGIVVGGGDGGGPRPDVSKARPAITATAVGWKAVSTIRQGQASVYGLTAAGAACKLADRNIQPPPVG